SAVCAPEAPAGRTEGPDNFCPAKAHLERGDDDDAPRRSKEKKKKKKGGRNKDNSQTCSFQHNAPAVSPESRPTGRAEVTGGTEAGGGAAEAARYWATHAGLRSGDAREERAEGAAPLPEESQRVHLPAEPQREDLFTEGAAELRVQSHRSRELFGFRIIEMSADAVIIVTSEKEERRSSSREKEPDGEREVEKQRERKLFRAERGDGTLGGSEETLEPSPPTAAQIRYVLFHNALPFVGFGFLDNAIMIAAGTQIELSIGVTLGISTMAAAALGNLVSDLAGLGLAGYVEALASKLGMQVPDLTPKQVDMWQTRLSSHMGKAIGVSIGCILGMFPLLFLGDDDDEDTEKEEKLAQPSSDAASRSS
ncbi:hypothetical protein L3Q82_015331, partial [Scortum barcoo]